MKNRPSSIASSNSRTGLHARISYRHGFTLVELLVTVSIIAIMASLFLGGLYSTQESGRIAATKATIAKINNLIMQRYESYRTRRVPVPIVITNVNGKPAVVSGGNPYTGPTPPQVVAAGWRLDALRELMRLEMPDHWNDVIAPPQPTPPGGWTAMIRPSLSAAYYRKYSGISPAPTTQYQEAECLYMICTSGVSDELDNREQFRPNEVGDVDGDGAQEFIDAWGTPIMFLRWAPGFYSELQTHNDPDPFDPRHVYPSAYPLPNGTPAAGGYGPASSQTSPSFALYPLIFSAGPDKLYGIVQSPGTTSPAPPFSYAPISGTYSQVINNDPFSTMASGSASSLFTYGGVGTRADIDSTPPATTTINSADNLHNHLMGTR